MMDKESTLTTNLGFKCILETDIYWILPVTIQTVCRTEVTLVQSIYPIAFTAITWWVKCSALNLVLSYHTVSQCAVKWFLRCFTGAPVLGQGFLPQVPHRPGWCLLCRSAQAEGVRRSLLSMGWHFHRNMIKNINGTHASKSFQCIWNSCVSTLTEKMRYNLKENGYLWSPLVICILLYFKEYLCGTKVLWPSLKMYKPFLVGLLNVTM